MVTADSGTADAPDNLRLIIIWLKGDVSCEQLSFLTEASLQLELEQSTTNIPRAFYGFVFIRLAALSFLEFRFVSSEEVLTKTRT